MSVKESDILRRLVGASLPAKGNVIAGVSNQDDCAVLAIDSGFELCATTDFVRGTGFLLFREGYLSLSDIGNYVVGANVSDLAAMGAKPLGYLSVVRYTPDRSQVEINAVLSGIEEACIRVGCPLIGGDTGTYESDVLSGTALGMIEKGMSLRRNRVRPGMAVFVSGDIGRPAVAMAAAAKQKVSEFPREFEHALEKWKKPAPRLGLGRALVETGLKVAAMDVSDGLSASLTQLSKINNVGFEINEKSLPICKSVKRIAEGIGKHPLEIACGASVDFELLFTAPSSSVDVIMALSDQVGTPVSFIGTATVENKISMKKESGEMWDIFPGVPWDHQIKDVKTMF